MVINHSFSETPRTIDPIVPIANRRFCNKRIQSGGKSYYIFYIE